MNWILLIRISAWCLGIFWFLKGFVSALNWFIMPFHEKIFLDGQKYYEFCAKRIVGAMACGLVIYCTYS